MKVRILVKTATYSTEKGCSRIASKTTSLFFSTRRCHITTVATTGLHSYRDSSLRASAQHFQQQTCRYRSSLSQIANAASYQHKSLQQNFGTQLSYDTTTTTSTNQRALSSFTAEEVLQICREVAHLIASTSDHQNRPSSAKRPFLHLKSQTQLQLEHFQPAQSLRWNVGLRRVVWRRLGALIDTHCLTMDPVALLELLETVESQAPGCLSGRTMNLDRLQSVLKQCLLTGSKSQFLAALCHLIQMDLCTSDVTSIADAQLRSRASHFLESNNEHNADGDSSVPSSHEQFDINDGVALLELQTELRKRAEIDTAYRCERLDGGCCHCCAVAATACAASHISLRFVPFADEAQLLQ